jgi:hypothetical protein
MSYLNPFYSQCETIIIREGCIGSSIGVRSVFWLWSRTAVGERAYWNNDV